MHKQREPRAFCGTVPSLLRGITLLVTVIGLLFASDFALAQSQAEYAEKAQV